MIGLDSNILLRVLMDDDPVQSPIARDLLAGLSAERRGYVNLIVLTEVVWTLTRKFKAQRDDVYAVVASLLSGAHLTVEARELVGLALDIAREQRSGFNDALIGVLNRHAGCMHTSTFDSRAPAEAGFLTVN